MGCMQSAKCNIKLNKLNQGNIPEAFGRYNISDKKLVKIYQKYCQQNGVIVRDIAAPEEQSQNHISNIMVSDNAIKRKQALSNAAPSLCSNLGGPQSESCSNNFNPQEKNSVSLNNINLESIRQINNQGKPQRFSSYHSIQQKSPNGAPSDSNIYSFHENPKIIRNLHLNKLFLKRKIQVHNSRFLAQSNSV